MRISIFNPFSKQYSSLQEFPKLTFSQKIVTLALTILATVATLFAFGVGGVATFRALVNKYKITPFDSENKKIADIDPFLKNFFSEHQCSMYGNVPFHEAKIICFADKHSNDNFAKVIGKIIDHFADDNNLIMTEQIAAYRAVSKDEVHKARLQFVTRSVNAIGWDILIEIPAYKKYNANAKNLKDAISEFDTSSSKFDAFEKVISALNEIKKTFVKNEDVANITKKATITLKEAFTKCNTKTLKFIMTRVSEMVFEVTDNAIYSNSKSEDMQIIRDTFKERNVSLCNVLESTVASHDKVFLIAGSAHLLTNSHNEWDNIANVKNTLTQNRFVIIVPNSVATEQRMSLNPEFENLQLF